ncbi:alpha/beta fold hydrolase [Roseovarius amoyensis]|uniref:alpha/beta fold hydrolase n=1 Tax=Roseovarius amoyensis TaxID=2211448 RepID=UPI0013A6DE57|nr:alpha/beta fold hydrolase [Roseovarius amoyensis]
MHLEPQVFRLLAVLAGSGGAVISKDELIDEVWDGLNVSDATVSARISAARRAVGDDGQAQRIIRTIPKRGIQMVAETETGDSAQTAGAVACHAAPAIRFTKSSDGELIAYSHHGEGPPLVRVSHWLSHLELDWDSPVWAPLLSRLGQSSTLYRYDQRGTGLSTRDVSNLTLDAFVDDLKAVMDANELERPAIFAASQAVPVAIRFAARYPDRVSRMVLYGGFAVGRIHRQAGPGEIDEETILGLIRAGWGQEDGAFLNAFSALFIPDATPEQVQSFVRIQNKSISPENAALQRMAVDRFVVEDDLPKVTVPVLLAHAHADAINPVSQSRMMAARLPDARFMLLDSRNHAPLPQEKSWGKLVDAVISFCAEGAGPGL